LRIVVVNRNLERRTTRSRRHCLESSEIISIQLVIAPSVQRVCCISNSQGEKNQKVGKITESRLTETRKHQWRFLIISKNLCEPKKSSVVESQSCPRAFRSQSRFFDKVLGSE